MKSMLSNVDLGININVCMKVGVVWDRGMGYEKSCEKESDVLEIKCSGSLVEMTQIGRVRNEEVHRRAGE